MISIGVQSDASSVAFWYRPKSDGVRRVAADCIVDLDPDGSPYAIEIVNFRYGVGQNVFRDFDWEAARTSTEFKTTYDSDVDVFRATLGRSKSSGQRVVSGTIWLDGSDRIVGVVAVLASDALLAEPTG